MLTESDPKKILHYTNYQFGKKKSCNTILVVTYIVTNFVLLESNHLRLVGR